MASSHKLKDVNGDPNLSSQDKSIDVRIRNTDTVSPDIEYKDDYKEVFTSRSINSEDHPIVPSVIKKQIEYSNHIKYDFDDLDIVPKSQTNILSRTDVNPYYKGNTKAYDKLPLFTAPMDTVVDLKTMRYYREAKINVVLPRTETYKEHSGQFNSFGLNDNIDGFSEETGFEFALLDVANGHMSSIIEWCSKLKNKYPHVKIMAGNIANPQTYKTYCSSGVIDYARVGIGNGNGCLTTQQTGVGYPMASLIAECRDIKIHHKNPIKIVADGGMKDYRDIIMALALGADYVMIGSIFAKSIESAAPNYWGNIKVGRALGEIMYQNGFNIHKEFRGMSTKQAQKALGNKVIKTSEGVVRKLKVEYTLQQWTTNFEDYLRSAMSYCNTNSLANFIGNVDTVVISNNALNRFKK